MGASDSKPPDQPPGTPFSPQQALEFMQKLWNPFGLPIPGFGVPGAGPQAGAPALGAYPGMPPLPNPAAMFAALDPVAVEGKIAELRVIEGWLTMSLSMMQMSIKTLELQKASLEAMRAAHAPSDARTRNR
jgi:hypothetical protein